MHRRAKQLLYGAGFLLVIGCVAALFYRVSEPPPSCFDNIQNQGEQGIDCGGPCTKACIPADLKPLEVLGGAVRVIPVDAAHVSLLTEVVNPNTGYGARSFAYAFSVAGAGAGAGQTFSGTSYIYPGEVKDIALPNVSLAASGVAGASIEFRNVAWVPAESFARPATQLGNVATAVSSSSVSVEGAAVNGDTFVLPAVQVVAVFVGARGEIAGVSATELSNLAPGESRPFTVLHPFIPSLDATATRVMLYALRP